MPDAGLHWRCPCQVMALACSCPCLLRPHVMYRPDYALARPTVGPRGAMKTAWLTAQGEEHPPVWAVLGATQTLPTLVTASEDGAGNEEAPGAPEGPPERQPKEAFLSPSGVLSRREGNWDAGAGDRVACRGSGKDWAGLSGLRASGVRRSGSSLRHARQPGRRRGCRGWCPSPGAPGGAGSPAAAS